MIAAKRQTNSPSRLEWSVGSEMRHCTVYIHQIHWMNSHDNFVTKVPNPPTTIAIIQWRDVLETVINSRKLTDAQANPSTQRKRYLSPN